MRWVEKTGWTIFNGCTEGDEEGEWTYTGGNGYSVIDYVLGDKEVREQVSKMEVKDNINSKHHPIIVWIKGGGDKEIKRGRRSRIKNGYGR